MRKNLNTEHIEGRVYQHSLELKVTGPNSKNPGTPYISGDLHVAIDDNEPTNVIPIHFTYVAETTGKGGKNRTFTALKKIIDNPENTWITKGKDNAFKVSVDTALALNEFYDSSTGELVSIKRNEGGFVTLVNKLDAPEKRNIFQFDMIINRTKLIEADEETGNDKDYLKIFGAIFNFRNDLLPIDLTVRNDVGINFFENLEPSSNNPVYIKLWGHINNRTVTSTNATKAAFGEALVVTKEFREWEVTGAAAVPYDFDDESTITKQELTEAMQNREVYLAEIKKRQEDYIASKKAAATPTPAVDTQPVKNGNFSF